MGLYRIRANLFRLGDNETITCIFIDKYLGGGRSAVALTLLSVADVLFGMKCYHLPEGYLASLGE